MAESSPKRVLILSASYGEGHNAAARGLQQAIEQLGLARAEVYDPFPEALGALYEKSRRDYLRMIERTPRLWALVYWLLHRTPLIFLTLPAMGGVRRALRAKIAASLPDVIVSVYPAYAYLLNQLHPRAAERPFRLYTIVTDSITINSVWHRSPSDAWLMPNEASAAVMRAAGVPPERLRTHGFPVPPIFAAPREPRVPPGAGEPLRVLYMVNADKRHAPALVARLLEVEGIALTVTAGRDEALQSSIREVVANSGKAAEVLGWTPDMPRLLMSHHVLIGKAGGAAVQETIAARTPMIITKVVPGQEEGNARLLVENGGGAVCETPDEIVAALRRLAASEGQLWRAWEAKIATLSRPDAALRMAEDLLREA